MTWKADLRAMREAWLLRRALRRRQTSKARFVAVTGSSGKTTTTGLIAHILSAAGPVASQIDNNVLPAITRLIARHPAGATYVVAETGIGRPGQMAPFASLIQPVIAVVTLVALEHRSAFRTVEAIADEKGLLVAGVRPGGMALLNADDRLTLAMAGRTRERVVTFGRAAAADYRAVDVRSTFPGRLTLTLEWAGGKLPLSSRFVGEHFWVSVAASAALALECGLPPDLVAARVASFEPDPTRCGSVLTRQGQHVIVDTVKAPWHSLHLAFEIVAKAAAPRKRIVLGSLSDFASNTRYRDAYRAAAAIADEIIFINDHAHHAKVPDEDRASGKFLELPTPESILRHLEQTATPGEVILLKGSGNLHLERIAIAQSRPVACWIPDCGRAENCLACGLYLVPYETHRGRKSWRGRALLSGLVAPWTLFARKPA